MGFKNKRGRDMVIQVLAAFIVTVVFIFIIHRRHQGCPICGQSIFGKAHALKHLIELSTRPAYADALAGRPRRAVTTSKPKPVGSRVESLA
jgi:hypothetical protein